MEFSRALQFTVALGLISALVPLHGCQETKDKNPSSETDDDESSCGVPSAIPDDSKSPWTDSSLNAIKKQWEVVKARPPSRSAKKGDAIKRCALEDVFRMNLSPGDLRKLAATCAGIQANPKENYEFASQLVAYLVVNFVHSGDRENLLKVLSTACPNRAWGPTPIEFFVAAYGWGRLSDPITIFAEAYAKSNSKEVRKVLSSAVRRAFSSTGIRCKDDEEFIRRSMEWYSKEKGALTVNSDYLKNDDQIPLETYEKLDPNPFDRSPKVLRFEPLFMQMQRKSPCERHADETIKLPAKRRSNHKPAALSDRQMKGEMDHLQGKWQAVSLTSFGKQLPKDRFEGRQVAINGDQFQQVDKRGSPTNSTMSICVNDEPHTMNLRTPPISDAKWQWTIFAIYKLEGDHLKICFSDPFGGPRPIDFKSDPEWCEEVMDLERVK